MFNKFDVKLFNLFNSSTVVLKFFAIEYKLSPLFTTYVFSLVDVVGIFSVWPILNKFDVRLFRFFIASTLVSNFLAIEYKLSPETTL